MGLECHAADSPRVRAFLGILLSLAVTAGADLESDLYKATLAKNNMQSVEATSEAVAEFVGPKRKKSHLALMFHDASCTYCRRALPELDRIALEMKGKDIAIGHVDVTANKAGMNSLMGLKGYPALIFWRRATANMSELLGAELRVDTDESFVLRACRHTGLSEERDKLRLQFLGKQVTVLKIDPKDITLQVEDEGGKKVWLPEEVFIAEGGQRLKNRRAEAMVLYQGSWDAHSMHYFLRRMMRPLIAEIKRMEDFSKGMAYELGPALVLCGSKLPRGFVEAATMYQLDHFAFHAKTKKACPVTVSKIPNKSRVVVFSPSWQQWSASRDGKAAALMGTFETVDDQGMVDWTSSHRYPGIMQLGYENFQYWLRSNRSTVLVALSFGNSKEALSIARLVEKQLRQLGKPQTSGTGVEVYSFEDSNRHYLGVVEGSLEGLDHYGVNQRSLPKVVVFESHQVWVEDDEHLRVDSLLEDMGKLPLMWRTSNTWLGAIVWALRHLGKMYMLADKRAKALGGTSGQIGYTICVGLASWMMLKYLWSCARSSVELVLHDDPVTTQSASAECEQKKTI
eukprot:TRINITY_DN18677_c0_g1_i1.p1 TRINITY_DN18677_c0_g1~~TRINITY_DN18677_c0_g1_i1.p1  ORF type:complete len:589 (-),score=109.33 TRINITY_DN18677_c0_g1_i1:203-1909(-)